ncbi:MAG: acetate--CoA ligase family protein [Candidatus Moduliflexus flocculans]|nr:acetate--CoA ligase family protein [Candidatus Moduliflexus flocculans]
MHKSDVGGVAIVRAEPAAVKAACAAMLRTVVARTRASDRKAVRGSVRGFLVVEKVAFEDVGFGSEILLGLRNSADFGPVLTVGSGGLDVEYMNARLKEGRAVGIASAHLLDEAGALRPARAAGLLRQAGRPVPGPQAPRRASGPGRDASPLPRPGRRVFGLTRRRPRSSSKRPRSIPSSSAAAGSCPWTASAGSPGARRRRPPGRSKPSAGCSSRRRSASSASRRR